MEQITDVVIFYGGIALAGGSALAALILVFIFKNKKRILRAELDKEYGKCGESNTIHQ